MPRVMPGTVPMATVPGTPASVARYKPGSRPHSLPSTARKTASPVQAKAGPVEVVRRGVRDPFYRRLGQDQGEERRVAAGADQPGQPGACRRAAGPADGPGQPG